MPKKYAPELKQDQTHADSHQHPAWFGSVMGTGAVAVVLAGQGTQWDSSIANAAGVAFLLLATAFALILMPRYALRMVDRSRFATELAHPAQGPMLATLPAGLLVLAIAWGRVGPLLLPNSTALWIDASLLTIGAVLALALGLLWSASIFQSNSGMEGINGGWLIPPVMNLLVPLGLAPLIVANPEHASLLLLIGFAFFGVGVLLFISIFTLFIARLVMHEAFPAAMAPSLWIPLAPAGISGLALMRLLESAQASNVPGFPNVNTGVAVAAMMFGFGLWWAAFACLELRRLRKTSSIPVHPGWWGFVFPAAAMTLSIGAMGLITDIYSVQLLALAATVLTVLLWLFVAARTLRMMFRKLA